MDARNIPWGDFVLNTRLGTKRNLVVQVKAQDTTPLSGILNFDEMQATAFFGPIADECEAAQAVLDYVQVAREAGEMESVKEKRDRIFREKEAQRVVNQDAQWATLQSKFNISAR